MKCLEGWKSKLLSRVGCTILIKLVIHSILSYSMGTFLLPKSTCREIDAVTRKLWWIGSLEKDHFTSFKAWEDLRQPKA